jgi:FKBP-type peptidyl-prolyl cis-trans isomerase
MPRTSKTWAGRHTAALIAGGTENTASTANSTTTSSSSTAPAVASNGKQLKTVLDKIIYAIRQQPGSKTSKGVSRLAITKWLKAELAYDNVNAIKTALKKGVEKGQLEQNGQSFRIKGDPVEEEDSPQLEIKDLKVGGSEDGNDDLVAQVGDQVTVKYVGKLDNGQQFDSAPSFLFKLGAGDVIKGWDQGIQGMKIGGKRKLIVPSKLGYGKRGCAPDIPGDATLHFVVTLKAIDRKEA